MASSQDDLGDLPEFVRDSRLEVIFQSNGAQFYTIHPRAASRRGLHAQDKWLHTRTLGAGGQGTVDLQTNETRHSRLPQLRAVKKIYIAAEKEEPSKLIRRELEAIFKFSQARYSELFVHSYGWFMSDRWVYIAMEYYELGDLQSYLQNKCPNKRLSESDLLPIASQVLDALYMMHREGFSHRDLKPANILIKDQPPSPWWVKLGDFGISKRGNEISQTTAIRGTPSFMPPELHGFYKNSGHHANGYAIDIWCLGGTIYRALTGHHVFEDLSDLALYCTGIGKFPESALKKVNASDNLIEFLSSVVVADPSKRPSAEDASAHPWVESQWDTEEPDKEENNPQSQQPSVEPAPETNSPEAPQHVEETEPDGKDSEMEQTLMDKPAAVSVEHRQNGTYSDPSLEPIDVIQEPQTVSQASPVTTFKSGPPDTEEASASWTANLSFGVAKPSNVPEGHEARTPQLPKKSERRKISTSRPRANPPQTAQHGTFPSQTNTEAGHHELRQSDEPSASWTFILHGDDSTTLSTARKEQSIEPEVKEATRVANEAPSQPDISQATTAKLRHKLGSVGEPSASTMGRLQGNYNWPPTPQQANKKPSSPSAPSQAATADLNTVKSIKAPANQSQSTGSATKASVVIRTDTPPIPVSSLKSVENYYSPSRRVNKPPKEEPEPTLKRSDSWIHGGFGNAPELPLSPPRGEGPKLPPLSGLKDKDGNSFKITSWAKLGKEAPGYRGYSEMDLPLPYDSKLSNTGSSSQVNYSYPKTADNPTKADDGVKVLYQAASIFEFHIGTTRHENGYPWLEYEAGEVFDIIAIKGELWLGRNQDDPYQMFGWLWEKHFVKLEEATSSQN